MLLEPLLVVGAHQRTLQLDRIDFKQSNTIINIINISQKSQIKAISLDDTCLLFLMTFDTI